MILGLTGSIGMGKSTVAAMLRHAGVPVFDADAAVHALQGPGGVLLGAIEAAFPGTTGAQGVDRAALGRAVFGGRAALRRLERIVHPAVGRMRADFLRRHRAHRLVVDDVPLLYENHGERRVDGVIVVSAPRWLQRPRVMARARMTAGRLAQIRRLQVSDQIKRARADLVIETGTTRVATARQVRRLVACLRAHTLRYCGSCVRSSSTPKPPG